MMEELQEREAPLGEIAENMGIEQADQELQELEESLSKIQVTTSQITLCVDKPEINLSEFSSSYTENTPKEKLLLSFAENFRYQYCHLYQDRKPLFLNPMNECGVEKFVSTTLRPTLLPYTEMYSWDGCASFVSDYLRMVPLDPPIDPVSGAASEKNAPQRKYAVKPARDLRSGFELQQLERKEAEVLAAHEKKRLETEKLEAERQQPPPDPLLGLRVHCWVLVLAGRREVPENFYIDPLSGRSFGTKDESFLGIESIWNHQNYWVNMQNCRYGCKELTFDLGDPVKWEFLLFGTGKPLLLIPDMEEIDDEEEKEEPKVFDMPPSWVEKIEISPKDMETRCPGGRKVVQYRKAKLEKFAPYLIRGGLVTRLTTFRDIECTKVLEVKEYFQHRQDHLEKRELNKGSGVTVEHFGPGRSHALKSHRYLIPVPETERQMDFYSEARADGLARRVETPSEMTETFENRTDFLYYRHVLFGKRLKKLAPANSNDPVTRSILKITECFHRNREKIANEDVAKKVFLISELRIQLTYHREDDLIVPSWREFVKPPTSEDKRDQSVIYTPDMATTFQVNPTEKHSKNLFLYETLISLLKEEAQAKQQVKESEIEVREILSQRNQEEIVSELTISVYDTARNEKARTHREEMEREEYEERLRQAEKELDFLAPFLTRMGEPENLSRQMALQLREECLTDLKQRLIDKANLIQARFEKETQELQKKQQWYQQNQMSMTKEDEDAYLSYCSDTMFRIHILELRLNRHKEQAPQKYLALEEKLRRDPRLIEHLQLW
ncbi:dynein regulatory complex subunit 7 [Huso huso]|uniref:Dynein regulatory complex subunit 7 n=1 Tax=Huso huso TaxID=61971 RepID=A0ABR0Z536_HUSHU